MLSLPDLFRQSRVTKLTACRAHQYARIHRMPQPWITGTSPVMTVVWGICGAVPLPVILAAQRRGSSVDRLRTWAIDLQERRGHNKATVALANKLARIVWAPWRHDRDFTSNP